MNRRTFQVRGRDESRPSRDEIIAELFEKRAPIRNRLSKRGIPPQDLEDATQDVFAKMLEVADRLKEPKAALTYALRVAGTVARDHRNHQRFDPLDEEHNVPASSFIQDPAMQRAIATLPKPKATAIHLVYFQGCTYEEAAERLLCCERALKGQVQSALKSLRKRFIPQITAGVFMEIAATGKRTCCTSVPAGTYRLGLRLHNQSAMDVGVQAQLTVAGLSVETSQVRLPKRATMEQLVTREFVIGTGAHRGAVTVHLDGILLPQRHLVQLDVA